MRRLFVVLTALDRACRAGVVFAHPLGNFTVNRFAAVELSGRDVFVHYVLDLAEIPTVQEGDRVRAAGFAAEVADRLDLELDGRRAELVPRGTQGLRAAGGGQGFRRCGSRPSTASPTRAARGASCFTIRTSPSRVGWKEIVVRAADGVRLVSSDVPAESTSDELRAYPQDLLRSPLDVTSAGARFVLGPGPGYPTFFHGRPAPERVGGLLRVPGGTGEPRAAASSSCRFSSPRSGVPRTR